MEGRKPTLKDRRVSSAPSIDLNVLQPQVSRRGVRPVTPSNACTLSSFPSSSQLPLSIVGSGVWCWGQVLSCLKQGSRKSRGGQWGRGSLLVVSVEGRVEEAALKKAGRLHLSFFPLSGTTQRNMTQPHTRMSLFYGLYRVDSMLAADPSLAHSGVCLLGTRLLPKILGFLTCPLGSVTHVSTVALAGQKSWWAASSRKESVWTLTCGGRRPPLFLAQTGNGRAETQDLVLHTRPAGRRQQGCGLPMK